MCDLRDRAQDVADSLVDAFKNEYLYGFLCEEYNDARTLYKQVDDYVRQNDRSAREQLEKLTAGMNTELQNDMETRKEQMMQYFFDKTCGTIKPALTELGIRVAKDIELYMLENEAHMVNYMLRTLDERNATRRSQSIRQTQELKSILRSRLRKHV